MDAFSTLAPVRACAAPSSERGGPSTHTPIERASPPPMIPPHEGQSTRIEPLEPGLSPLGDVVTLTLSSLIERGILRWPCFRSERRYAIPFAY